MINSRKKKIALIITFTLLTFFSGILIGIGLAKPYFQSNCGINLMVDRVIQANTYAMDLEQASDELMRHLLIDIEFNLSKLLLMKEHMSSLRKERLCLSLLPLIEHRPSLLSLANQFEDSGTHLRRIEDFLGKVAHCNAW